VVVVVAAGVVVVVVKTAVSTNTNKRNHEFNKLSSLARCFCDQAINQSMEQSINH